MAANIFSRILRNARRAVTAAVPKKAKITPVPVDVTVFIIRVHSDPLPPLFLAEYLRLIMSF